MVFFFIDNSTVEAALYKGNSSSRKLFELVVRSRKLQMKYSFQVTVSHVSGKRMMAQGTDGVSQGCLREGVGSGHDMLSFIPLHLSCLDRSESTKCWIKSWLGQDVNFLTPDDWFQLGHDIGGGRYDSNGFWRPQYKSGTYIWTPPPGAALTAIEQLRRAVIKRQSSTHIFVVPSTARDGDHLLVPFECDWCMFRKLRSQSPDPESVRDKLLLGCIRRIILDSFWSRASSTVAGNRDKVRGALELSQIVGLDGPFVHTRVLPEFDHCGYEVAIQMVMASRRSGKYSNEHLQWETIRKVRTCYSNFIQASPQENVEVTALGSDQGVVQRLVHDPCTSFWFSNFFEGCKRRMGQNWRPNQGMSVALIQRMMQTIERKITGQEGDQEQDKWILFGTYFVVTYTLSLRGNEGLLYLDLGGLIEFIPNAERNHFYITFLGQVKGEQHQRCHVLPCVNVTSSGLNVKSWIDRLIELKKSQQLVDGPAVSDRNGKVLSTQTLDEIFINVLEEVYEEKSTLFPISISEKDDIARSYQVFRSPRRSSDTRAIECKVSKTDIEIVNRWHSMESAKGNRPNMPMHQHYAQADLLLQPYLRYTYAM